jgi:hypothetical protein
MMISIEERNRWHDHSGSAVSALQGACFEKCPLHGMQLFAASQTFNGDDLFLGNRFGSGYARALGSSIDQDSAGSALTLSAPVLGSSQIKVLAQYSEKAGLRIGIDRTRASIYSKLNRSHCDHPDGFRNSRTFLKWYIPAEGI